MGPFQKDGYTFRGGPSCIYCGHTPPSLNELTEEHIVPFSLSGDHKIAHASCSTCARITETFERKVTRGHLLAARLLTGARRRNRGKKNKRPQKVEVFTSRTDGLDRHELLLDQLPLIQLMPKMMLVPRILTGLPPNLFSVIVGNPVLVPKDVSVRTANLGAFQFGFARIDIDAHCRMLSKIGYCFAVAMIGTDNFEPEILDYILGKTTLGCDWFVGDSDFTGPPDEERRQQTHKGFNSMALRIVSVPSGCQYLAVDLLLQGQVPHPAYTVVVGRLRPVQKARCCGAA